MSLRWIIYILGSRAKGIMAIGLYMEMNLILELEEGNLYISSNSLGL